MYSYSRTKGLFGGASVEGSVIVERSDANSRSYGFNVTARQLLSGAVEVPEFADQLIETISRRSGNATNWSAADNDEGDPDGPRPDEGRGYAFGSQFAAGGTGSGSGSGKSGGGGIGSKIAGSIGRSRASSRASGGGGGPAISTSIKFDQDFGDDYSREQRANVSWGAGDDERQQRVRSATVGASSSKGRGAAADSAKLTKPRAGSVGVFGGARSKADAIAWRSPPSSSRSSEGYRGSRDSFDSLDDDDDDERERRPAPRRFSNHHDLGSDDDLDNIGKSATPLRFPPSSIRSNSFANSSPFGDDAASPSPSRPSPSSKKSYSTKPWDSEDEDLMNFSSGKPRSGSTSYALSSSSPPRVISSHLVNKGDPFDFSQVDVDFASGSVGGRDGYANAAGMARSRSRASTVGKGLGSAVALFEFSSTEVRFPSSFILLPSLLDFLFLSRRRLFPSPLRTHAPAPFAAGRPFVQEGRRHHRSQAGGRRVVDWSYRHPYVFFPPSLSLGFPARKDEGADDPRACRRRPLPAQLR